MFKYGLEQEFFIENDKSNLVVVPDYLPHDSCGLLVEARGKPFASPFDAVCSLMADVLRIKRQVSELTEDLNLLKQPIMQVSRVLRIEAQRKYEKGLLSYKNLYGFNHHANKITEQTAGIHVSFTNEKEFSYYTQNRKSCERTTHTYNTIWDFPTIVTAFDKRYSKEIAEAKRKPGFYEIKDNGRIEYRSLPNNIDLEKLANFILDLKRLYGM